MKLVPVEILPQLIAAEKWIRYPLECVNTKHLIDEVEHGCSAHDRISAYDELRRRYGRAKAEALTSHVLKDLGWWG